MNLLPIRISSHICSLFHVVRFKSSKVPQQPHNTNIDEARLPPRTVITQETIEVLERLSFVGFSNERAIERLEEAIHFADQLTLIDTTGVEPLVTVLEDRTLFLREDTVCTDTDRKLLMRTAPVKEDIYYIAPPSRQFLATKNSSREGKSLDSLAFGPVGELLVNNLKEEWMFSCVTNSSKNVFPFYRGSAPSGNICEDIKDSFYHVKKLCKGQLPFSLAEIRQQSKEIGGLIGSTRKEEDVLKLSKGTVLRSFQFLSPEDANRSFTILQRERKIWWRKFSSFPGRFKLSEVISSNRVENGVELNDESLQSVQILSDFDWGTGAVETLRLWPSSTFATNEKLFEFREGKRSVLPCVLESIVTLEVAALVYLCDAFDGKTDDNVIMRLHRRIAPFKVSFTSSVSKDLQSKAYALAEHLTVVLRRAGHTTLLLPKMREESLESSLASHNQIGVPFIVVLSDSSLTDGIIHLYSRETSLQEQVHITQLVNYMNQLLKSTM